MPKKVHNRPNRAKNRARRPQRPAGTAPEAVETPTEVSPAPAAARPLAPPSEPRTSAVPAATRRGAARRAPVITINYSYLRHDLRMLAVLAPLMVVLLVVAYAVLHNV